MSSVAPAQTFRRPEASGDVRVLVVLDALADDPDQAALAALAGTLAPRGVRIEVAPCRLDAEAVASARASAGRFSAAGVPLHLTAHHLSLVDTIAWLADLAGAFDVVVARSGIPDVRPALASLGAPPPLLEDPDWSLPHAWWAERLVRAAAGSRRNAGARSPLFRSFLQGGFECSTHRRGVDGRRVDVIAATGHDRMAREDYATLGALGIRTVRDGVRWHLVEPRPGAFSLDSLEAQVEAAVVTGTEVVWDLLHYGWPDHLDVWAQAFPDQFASFAAGVARHLAERLPAPRWYVVINEISFTAWGAGDVGYLNPFAHGRGLELKVQLARAAITAARAIRAADPDARFLWAEPAIHIVPRRGPDHQTEGAERHRRAQFEALDMVSGRAWPQLGGSPDLLDVVGLNYYPTNQWEHGDGVLPPDDERRRPLADLLASVAARYGRPVCITETGTEGDERVAWLEGVLDEVDHARARGVDVQGVCLYPVLDHPGWDNDRYCPNGLLRYGPDGGRPGPYEPLARLIRATASSWRPEG